MGFVWCERRVEGTRDWADARAKRRVRSPSESVPEPSLSTCPSKPAGIAFFPNYYGRFIENLSYSVEMVKKMWTILSGCQGIVVIVKVSHTLWSSPILLKLAGDTSAYGVGVVISHILPDGTEPPLHLLRAPWDLVRRIYSRKLWFETTYLYGQPSIWSWNHR